MATAFLLNPRGRKRPVGRKRSYKKNRAGIPKAPRGRQYRDLVKQYGVVEAARKWRKKKRKPKYAKNATYTYNRKRRTKSMARKRKKPKASRWSKLVKKHGVQKAAKKYKKNARKRSSRKSSRKRKRTYKRNKMTKAQRSAAAKKGWRTRRRNAKKSSKKTRKRTKKRSYRRNKMTKAKRSAAAKKGWRTRRRNSKKGKRKSRKSRSYKKNPTIVKQIQKVFSMDTLMEAGVMGAGAVGTRVGTASILPRLNMADKGIQGALGNLVVSALLSWGAGFMNKKWSKPILQGGLVATMERIIAENILTPANLQAVGLQAPTNYGIADYVTFGKQGMGDYVTFGKQHQMGEFLPSSKVSQAMIEGPSQGGFAMYEDIQGLDDYYGVTAF